MTALSAGGKIGDAIQVIALAEGMDPGLPPQTISRALLARSSARSEDERRSALTDFIMAGIARGAQVEYWDAVSHLYTASEMREIRRRRAEAEERKRQMEAVRDMTEMSRHLFGK